MHIGLIGGIGPAATLVYYDRLTAKARAAGVPFDLTIVHADITVLAANARADNRDAQAAVYARHIDQLAAAGAEVAAITSIGGSFCIEETRARSCLPLASAVAPLDPYFVAHGIDTVGILGTETVMRNRLYGRLSRTRAVVPSGDLAELGQAYVDIAVSGSCDDERRTRFFEAGREMIEKQGADAVVLAGTDLGLAFDNHDPGFPVIDAIDPHVDMLFDLATGALPLSRMPL